jgi:hypothetical protein
MDTGAHHECWPVLQALFMIARTLPVATNTITTATTNVRRLFIRDPELPVPHHLPMPTLGKAG